MNLEEKYNYLIPNFEETEKKNNLKEILNYPKITSFDNNYSDKKTEKLTKSPSNFNLLNIIKQFSNSPKNWTKKKIKTSQNISTSNFLDNLKTQTKINEFSDENNTISETIKIGKLQESFTKKYVKKDKKSANKIKQLILPSKIFFEESFKENNKEKIINCQSFK